MGSKSSSTPPPDPRLVEAQMRSMGIQDSAIQQILANSQSLMPLQKEQMQFGLDTAKTAYGQSQQDRDWMLTRRGVLSGLQDQLVGDAKNFNTEARGEELAGLASADVNRSFDSVRGQSARSLARQGINPSSGRAGALDSQLAIGQSLALAGGANAARRSARDEGRYLTDRASNALAGYPAMSAQATGAGAGYGSSGITIANTGLAGMNSGFGSAAQVAGQMGANATQMWGQQANYKTQQDNLMSSDLGGVGSLLGGAAAIYKTGLFGGSDPSYKRRIVRLHDHALGIGIYSFEYLPEYADKWGHGPQVGVMANEVMQVMPAAVSKDADGHTVVNYAMLRQAAH